MTITNDRAAEENETFTVILEKPSHKSFPQVRINPGVVTITISDDEQRKCIVFGFMWSDDTFNIMWVVQVKFKLCHMTQILLELRFTTMDSRVSKVAFLYLQMCRYITN